MMNEADKSTLSSLELLLVADRVSPKAALDAAYNLGRLSGQIEMARVGETVLADLHKLAA